MPTGRIGDPVRKDGHLTWSFEPTKPIPTYISCVCAGPWHVVRDRHRNLDLGLYCRQSLAQYLDPEEILFCQQLVQPGLVDPADDGCFLLAVADALGQRE